jgi:hypothetical protein
MDLLKQMTHLAKSGRARSFSVFVNDACQVTVCKHGENGEAVDFISLYSVWELPLVLAKLLVEAKGGAASVNVIQDSDKACRHSLGENRWSDAAAILNGKPGVKRARLVERYFALPCSRYIERKYGSGKYVYVVTEVGQKLDAMHEAKQPKAV